MIDNKKAEVAALSIIEMLERYGAAGRTDIDIVVAFSLENERSSTDIQLELANEIKRQIAQFGVAPMELANNLALIIQYGDKNGNDA